MVSPMSSWGIGAFLLALAAATLCNAAGGEWWETLIVAVLVVAGLFGVTQGPRIDQESEEHRQRMKPVFEEMNREREGRE